MEEQTAVEWLVEQMKLDELFNADYFIKQAKEMENEQTMYAFNKGLSFAINPIPKPEDAKNYYKKRIKKTNDR